MSRRRPLAPWTHVKIKNESKHMYNGHEAIINEVNMNGSDSYSLYILREGKIVNECAWYEREQLEVLPDFPEKRIVCLIELFEEFEEETNDLEEEFGEDEEDEFDKKFQLAYEKYMHKEI